MITLGETNWLGISQDEEVKKTVHDRKWGSEELLTYRKLAYHPRVPLKRNPKTWRNWIRNGVIVNGIKKIIPRVVWAGRVHTSLEAVMEVFNGAGVDSVPPERVRKRRATA